uniref:Uncharacterized protein n=1 Tax=Picea glauca TaxID=3330 RepID=A0A101M2Y3_PICGL|nr:hypothetical protein ABT39_MTgene3309 [Picea glauca]
MSRFLRHSRFPRQYMLCTYYDYMVSVDDSFIVFKEITFSRQVQGL